MTVRWKAFSVPAKWLLQNDRLTAGKCTGNLKWVGPRKIPTPKWLTDREKQRSYQNDCFENDRRREKFDIFWDKMTSHFSGKRLYFLKPQYSRFPLKWSPCKMTESPPKAEKRFPLKWLTPKWQTAERNSVPAKGQLQNDRLIAEKCTANPKWVGTQTKSNPKWLTAGRNNAPTKMTE